MPTSTTIDISGPKRDITAELWNALKDFDIVNIGAGICTLSRTMPVRSGRMIIGATTGPNNDVPATTIVASDLFADDDLNVDDAMFVIGTASTAVAELPFRGGALLYGTRKALLAPFSPGATTLSLANTSLTFRQDFKTALNANDKNYAYIMTAAYWRKEFGDFRPLQGQVVKILTFNPNTNVVQLDKPLDFYTTGIATTIDDGVIAIYAKGDYNGQTRVNNPIVSTAAALDPQIGHDITIRNLILRAPGKDRPPIIIWGGYDVTLENLELHGFSFTGGNAMTRCTLRKLRGSFSRRMIDCGFTSSHNEFTDWRADKVGCVTDSPLFQCSESSESNHFDGITVQGEVAIYQEGFRLQSVRQFKIENITLNAVFERSAVSMINHDKEFFLVVQPSGPFNPMGGITIGSGPSAITQSVDRSEDKPIKAGQRPDVKLLSWTAPVMGFQTLAKPGTQVTDTGGGTATIVYAVKASYTGTISDPLDTLYEEQLKIWDPRRMTPLPKLALVSNPAITFDVIDIIALNTGSAIFAYSSSDPAVAPNAKFTCSLFTGVEFTPVSAVIDDDNPKKAMPNAIGQVKQINAFLVEIKDLLP